MKAKLARNTNKVSVDKPFLISLILLLLIGLVAIHNATVIYSHDLFGGAYRFVFLQLGWAVAGLIIFYFICKTNYSHVAKLSRMLFLISLVPLVFLAILGLLSKIGLLTCSNQVIFAPCINGAYRWFYFNPPPLPKIPLLGVLGFQPSEFAKFTLIMFLASKLATTAKDTIASFKVYITYTLLVFFLVLLQPNMSTAVLILIIATLIYFASGASILPLIVSSPFAILSIVGLMVSSAYRRERLMTLLGFSPDSELSMGYHIRQVLIALGSGGMFGIGLGQSRQKFQYLPEVSSDSIFAIIGEEMGFFGASLILFLFLFLIYRGLQIAKKAPDLFGKLVSVGVMSWIGFQLFINIAAMTKIIPLTGVPIPLISYGGSSLIFTLMGLGVVANVSKNS